MNATAWAQHEIEAEEQFGVELMDYAGQWVARRDRKVVEQAPTLDALLERIKGQERQVVVFRVPDQPEALCFY